MIRRTLLAVWLLVCGAVLAFTLYAYAPGPKSDASIVFASAMSALCFPSGLIVSGVIAILAMRNDGNLPEPMSEIPAWVGFTVTWFAFCGVGYFQWFRFLPWLWHKLFRQSGDKG